jgi:ATP-dependent Clp protease ATP-binding subunit ClpB
MFTPLTRQDVKKIVLLQFQKVEETLADKGVKIILTDAALDWIAQIGYNPQLGARPIKRMVQKHILNELSKQILADTIDKSKNIVIDYFGTDTLIFLNK